MTKARACKGVGQEGSLVVTSHALGSVGECEGMNPHTPKWTPTLGIGVPLDSRTFKEILRGQNSLDWIFFCIIRKLLERTCLKWACMTHLETSNTSYGQKKSEEGPLKSRIYLKYHWKALDEGYNFASNIISIRGLHVKLWAPKVKRVPIMKISKLSLGSPRTKWHLGVGLMAMQKIYRKGEGGGFPQVAIVVSLMNPCLLVACPCIKVLQLRTNQLFVWFVHIRVSNWCLSLSLIPISELQYTPLPLKWCKPRNVP
jgi:hypothetical protein